jgi:hypothetical protein
MDHDYAAEDVRSGHVSSVLANFEESSDESDGLPQPQEDIAGYRDVLTSSGCTCRRR